MVGTTPEEKSLPDSSPAADSHPRPDLSPNLDAASRIISSAVKWSAATSLIPIPVVDLVALGGVQAKMVADLCRQYGHSFSDEAIRGVLSVLIGTILPNGLANYATAAIARGVPGVGVVVSIVTFGGFAGAATYAIGKIFVAHFEGGGTFKSFSPEAVRADLAREFAHAKAR